MCFTESQAKLTAAMEDHVILALQAFKLARELVSLSSLIYTGLNHCKRD